MIGKLIECVWHKLVERVMPFDDDVIDRLIAEHGGPTGQPLPAQSGDYCECCDPDVTWCRRRHA